MSISAVVIGDDKETNQLQQNHHMLSFNRAGPWSEFLLAIKIKFDEDNVIDTIKDKTCWSKVYIRVFDKPIWMQKKDEIQLFTKIDLSNQIPSYEIRVQYEIDGKTLTREVKYN